MIKYDGKNHWILAWLVWIEVENRDTGVPSVERVLTTSSLFAGSYEIEECSRCGCDSVAYDYRYGWPRRTLCGKYSSRHGEEIIRRQHGPNVNVWKMTVYFTFRSDVTVQDKGFNFSFIALSDVSKLSRNLSSSQLERNQSGLGSHGCNRVYMSHIPPLSPICRGSGMRLSWQRLRGRLKEGYISALFSHPLNGRSVD